jgi:hypothetical protein
MVFGPPYVRLIGREKLLSAPCFTVKELSSEHVYLQVTAEVADLRRDFGGFEALGQRLKRHLGEGLFLEPTGAVASAVPEFTL